MEERTGEELVELVRRAPSPDRLMKFEPTPDLLVYREDPTAPPGTPDIVVERLCDLARKREIQQMWMSERTRTYIPNTEEARKMRLAAKLHSRLETKHAEVVKRELVEHRRIIETDASMLKILPAIVQ